MTIRLIQLCLMFVLCATPALAADAILTWNANTESDLSGYRVYRGNLGPDCSAAGPLQPLMAGTPPAAVQVGKVTTYTDAALPPLDGTYCWELTAFDTSGNVSGRSNRVSKAVNLVPPAAPSGLNVVIQ